MRKFFFNILQDIKVLTGLNQYDNLIALPNGKEELTKLLNALCQASDNFKNIPEEHKQRFIREGIMSDSEFTGLNAKIVYKWLIARNHMYIHMEDKAPENYEPLTGEERQKYLDLWLKSLGQFDENVKVEHGGTRLKTKLDELPAMQGYKSPGFEELEKSELHTQYIRENYDPITAKPKDNWIPENEWLDNLNKKL